MLKRIHDYLARKKYKKSIPLYHHGSMKAWLEELDLTDPLQSSTHIQTICREFLTHYPSHIHFYDPSHIEPIFLLDGALLSTLNNLHVTYIQSLNHARTTITEHSIIHNLTKLINSISSLYDWAHQALLQHNSTSPKVDAIHTELIIRMVHIRTHAMRLYHYQHLPIPQNEWKKIHSIYALAEYKKWNFLISECTTDIPCIEDNYIYALLIGCLGEETYGSDTYPFIDDILANAPTLALSLPKEDQDDLYLTQWVDLSSNQGLQNTSCQFHTHIRLLDTAPLISYLTQLNEKYQDDEQHQPSIETQLDLTPRIELINKLCQHWMIQRDPVNRIAERISQDKTIQWITGFSSIQQQYQKAHDDARHSWERLKTPFALTPQAGFLRNYSDYGCALHISCQDEEPAVGMLIAYQFSHDTIWHIGIIRRIKRLINSHIEAGIEHLGANWSRIEYLPTTSKEHCYPAIYFPLDPLNTLQQKALLIPSELFYETHSPHIRLGKSIYPITFASIVEKKRDWILLYFDL